MGERVTTISKDMEKAISQSGYLLELEVDNMLKKSTSLTTPIYTFQQTDGAVREIDILGESSTLISERKVTEFVTAKMLIEVKNVSPVVCFPRKVFVPVRCFLGDFQFSGMPKYVWKKKNEGVELLDYLNIEKFHHYYRNTKLSSQLCVISEKRTARQGETCFIASHRFAGDRNLYDELVSPLIEGIIHLKREHEEDWKFDPKGEPIDLTFYYPIAVVTDLFECYISKMGPTYRKVHRVSFMRMHKSEEISGDLLRIDICDKTGFQDILKSIELEMGKIIRRVKANKVLIRKSAMIDAKKRSQETNQETKKIKR
jgi:hypothetical protein